MKCLKSRSSLRFQEEYPDLNKRYWDLLLGYRLWCLEYSNLTGEMVDEYLENNRKPGDGGSDNLIIE